MRRGVEGGAQRGCRGEGGEDGSWRGSPFKWPPCPGVQGEPPCCTHAWSLSRSLETPGDVLDLELEGFMFERLGSMHLIQV